MKQSLKCLSWFIWACFATTLGQNLQKNQGSMSKGVNNQIGMDELQLVATANKTVDMDSTSFVEIGLVYNGPGFQPSYNVNLTFSLKNPDGTAFHIANASLFYTSSEIAQRVNKSVYVEGILIGVNSIEVYAEILPLNLKSQVKVRETKLGEVKVVVVQPSRLMNQIFNGVITAMVIINTINMGSALDLSIVKGVFRKPIGPAVGAFCQFVAMPLVSYGVGYAMFDDPLFRLGLFALGCSPGGNNSNFWCILLGGDLNLSITMTFFSTIIAVGMMPFWMFVLGSTIVDSSLVIPYVRLLLTLITLICPVLVGMLIRAKWQKGAQFLTRIIVPFTILVLIFMLTGGIYTYRNVFRLMTVYMVLGGFGVTASGYIIGAGLAALFRLGRPQIIAVSIETAFQNGAIALLILQMSFEAPYNDMATVAPISQIIVTGIPMWLILIGLKIYQRIKAKDNPGQVEVKVEEKVDVESQLKSTVQTDQGQETEGEEEKNGNLLKTKEGKVTNPS